MPGSSSSAGAIDRTSGIIANSSSRHSSVSCLTLFAVLRKDNFVAAYSGSVAVSGRSRWQRVTNAIRGRPRSSSRRSTGAVTTRALSTLIAATRASFALSRAVMSVRSPSRVPRDRGVAQLSRPRISRAARTASRESDFAPSLAALVLGWSNSMTNSPFAAKAAARPAP